jgi:hypothetical protein
MLFGNWEIGRRVGDAWAWRLHTLHKRFGAFPPHVASQPYGPYRPLLKDKLLCTVELYGANRRSKWLDEKRCLERGLRLRPWRPEQLNDSVRALRRVPFWLTKNGRITTREGYRDEIPVPERCSDML